MNISMSDRISSGDVLVGGIVNIFAPAFVETYCRSGADFIFIDHEHGLKDLGDIQNAIIVADACGVPALVRVGDRSCNFVGRVLDAGAAGILFPHVCTAEEAAELVSWCRYKPQGTRALGYNRAWSRHAPDDRVQRSKIDKAVVCIMAIEDLQGADNLASILATDGVSGVAMGPGDLSLELNVDSWDAPELVKLLDDMAKVAASFPGKGLMRLALSRQQAARHVQGGANMLVAHHDVVLIKEMYTKLFADLAGR